MNSGVLSFCRKFLAIALVLSAVAACALNFSTSVNAVSGINQQINFQGRLFNAQGATVPDGYYNIEFNIYQDGDGLTAGNTTGSPAGTLKWTEDYLNANGKGVVVKNGFLSVQLGSVNPFGTSVDWNQDTLWLSMNIAGTGVACTPFAACTPDGEMVPMKRLSSATYAMNTNRLNGLTSTQFIQLAQGVQTDASTNTSSIFINKTGTGNLLQLQSSGTDAFTLNNSGDISFGANANHTINVTTAAADTAGKTLTIGSGSAGTGLAALAGGDLLLQGGNGGGTNGNGGNVAIDAGVKNGTGTNGAINIGTSTASTIQIGSITLASGTQAVNIGNNGVAGSITNVTIGAGSTATGGTTTIRSKNDLTVTTSNGNMALTSTAGTMGLTSSGNSSITATAGTFSVSSSGNASLTSTAGTVALNSNGNTTIGTNSITRATFDTSNNLYLGNGITAATPTSFVVSGTGSSTTGVAGGSLNLQGGNATVGNANGGNISIDAGTKFGSGTDGNINIGSNRAVNIQIGNPTLAAGTQTINIGDANTAGGTTNVTIGTGSTATAGTTTIQGKGNVNVTSASGNVGVTATAGTMSITSSGNSSISATAGTFSTSSSGNTTITSTAGTVGLVSNGATTVSTNGNVKATFATTYGLYLGAGVTGAVNPFTIAATGGTAGVAGSALTVQGGAAGSSSAGGALSLQGGAGGSTTGAGGATTVQGGNATAGNSNGGDLTLNAGTKFGSGADGNIYLGNNNVNTIQIGNNAVTAAATQTITLGTTTTGTTNVTIGSASGATGGATTVQGKGNVNVTSASGNVGVTATAGTMSITSSGNSSISATAGTFSTSSSGNTTITSTAGTVGVASSGNTTISTNGAVRSTFDTANNLYLGNGTTGAVNPFTISSTGGTAGVAGSNLTVKAGTGGSSSAGGILAIQGGAGGSTTGAGGATTVQGGNATAGNSNGGDLSLNAGTKFGSGADGNIYLGNNNVNTIQIGNNAVTAAATQTISMGTTTTGTTNVTIGSASGATGGTTTVQGKGNVNVTSASGNVDVTATAGTMTISGNGATALSSVAGTLALTGYTDASLTSTTGNTTVGSTAGTVGINSKTNTTVTTNGTIRATFDTANGLYLGNGVTATAPNNFLVSGTGSSTTAVTGGAVTIQGGNATVGSANGGNLTLSGGTGVGTGVNGLVVINTPTFSTTINDANCYTSGALVANSCTIAATSVNNSGAILVGFSATGKTATLPDPTISTAGRVVYITAANSSQDFTLSVNAGGMGNQIAMRQNTTATMIWNGADWTAAGASSSTTLQSAYDNTMQSAGGAELIVSRTGTTNGLTIRDSATNPVDGTLLSVQTASAAGLFSVNGNVDEYSSDSGAETMGASASTFPASTWSSVGSATVSRYTTTGNYIATGQASVSVAATTTANDGVKNTLTTLSANTTYNVSFTTRLTSGTFTDLNVYYSINGTAASVACATGKFSNTSVWTKVNCSFTAPASGITATNAILIRQTAGGTARTFYVDNLSVTIAANYNYATDGAVNDGTNFAANWSFVNATSGAGTATRNTSDGYDASDSATATITTGAANAGIRNKLSINPMINTLYRITSYVKLNSGTFTDFKIRYSRDGSTSSAGNYIDCTDYNTQTITTTSWTKITCYVTTDGTAATNPYVNFVEGSSAVRTYSVDTFSMTLSSNSTPNVQIGGGLNGGPTTLLTLDRGASAPIASDNDALLGSMYYDTTLGKLQCYEADGWGACGSSPDNVVTISPEYNNAVMHGIGVGTMTSDLCSSTLGINDGTFGQPTICGANETYNFYKWTSPQASEQIYSIYVTYQLPSTFKSFASGQTSIMGRTDSNNSTVQYQIYRNDASTGLTACGSALTVSTGVKAAWQIGTASGTADPSTCGFAPGNSIVFMINMKASLNANAYVGNLNFIYSNK